MPTTPRDDASAASMRYRVVFTPVGWQVVDSQIARDPLHEFGTGPEEYEQAKEAARVENERADIEWREWEAKWGDDGIGGSLDV